MTYALRFLPEVDNDVWSGRTWYEGKLAGLGEEFLRVFYACSQELTDNPLAYPKIHREFRRRLLRRFPYAVYFRIESETIVIFGVFHCARDPRRLRRELGDRQ
jgi:plasmid stabilization system protein ParE